MKAVLIGILDIDGDELPEPDKTDGLPFTTKVLLAFPDSMTAGSAVLNAAKVLVEEQSQITGIAPEIPQTHRKAPYSKAKNRGR